MDTITLYEAIAEMRKLSAQEKTFSFVHVTYNRDSGTSDGIRQVRRAKVRPAARKDDVANADYKLFYYDMDQQLPRVCWQPLILFFNGKKVVL